MAHMSTGATHCLTIHTYVIWYPLLYNECISQYFSNQNSNNGTHIKYEIIHVAGSYNQNTYLLHTFWFGINCVFLISTKLVKYISCMEECIRWLAVIHTYCVFGRNQYVSLRGTCWAHLIVFTRVGQTWAIWPSIGYRFSFISILSTHFAIYKNYIFWLSAIDIYCS